MTTCFHCAKPITDKVSGRRDFPHHPECYSVAELEANCELHSSDRDEFARFEIHVLASYWNVLQMSAKCLQVTDDPYKMPRHRRFVKDELTKRGFKPVEGKLLTAKQAAWIAAGTI